jgi:DNA gyrase/topoisomerase IV subunit A
MTQAEDMRDRAQRRLSVLDALCASVPRRNEILATIAGSEDANEALGRVKDLLGVADGPAQAVLDLRLIRFTRDQVSKLELERRDLLRLLDELS